MPSVIRRRLPQLVDGHLVWGRWLLGRANSSGWKPGHVRRLANMGQTEIDRWYWRSFYAERIIRHGQD